MRGWNVAPGQMWGCGTGADGGMQVLEQAGMRLSSEDPLGMEFVGQRRWLPSGGVRALGWNLLNGWTALG